MSIRSPLNQQEIFARLTRLEPPFPRAAAEEARLRWNEWGEDFIALIENVANGGEPYATDENGEERYDGRFAFACWLAAEKRDQRAYRPLIRAAHCSAERAEDIFGDDVTEGLHRWLASTCDGDLEPIKALAEDENASLWCRVAALNALAVRVVERDLAREDALGWLTDFCRREAERLRHRGGPSGEEKDDILTHAADVLGDLGPAEHLGEIRTWFEEGLVDPGYSGLDFFEAQARRPVTECLAELRDNPHHRYVSDALAEMEGWHCFREEDDSPRRALPKWFDRLLPERSGVRCIVSGGTYQRETPKVGRNDPCPCGSGKKFKKCCGRELGEQPTGGDASATAVRRALDWLAFHHEDSIGGVLYNRLIAGLEDDEIDALDRLAPEDWNNIRTNLLEWLLAEGRFFDLALKRRASVPELLLGPSGPAFSAAEREWIEELARRPLSLYTVTQVVPGETVTLVDALAPAAVPLVVHEKAGSRQMRPGMKLASRVVRFEGRWVLAGCLYLYGDAFMPALMEEIEAVREDFGDAPAKFASKISAALFRHWLLQYLRPPPLPTLIDHYSGEPLLFITDRYRVLDWRVLEATLAREADLEGDRAQGWTRRVECEDGEIHARLGINPVEGEGDVIEVFYRTRQLAEEGRPWFEAIAGAAVEFLGRETRDPKADLMLAALGGKAPREAKPADLPAEVKADLIEKALRRHYANWADEPIPALGNQTPRQAIATPAGLERVKGLLRSYADREKEMAEQAGRRPISYDFLWRTLGLSPE